MRIRDIAAMSLGNILEWFDFGLFIYCASLLGNEFFYTTDLNSSTLAAFGVFAAGYLSRPLGGIVFGYFGDTMGRVNSLRGSILIMSFSTLAVGLLPGYQAIGMAAPILFTLIRIVQGISAGGEYCGIMIYLAESAPVEKRGWITSFAACGANLGYLLATLTILLMKNFSDVNASIAWFWRVPFILLGLVGIVIFIFRLRLKETAAYRYLQSVREVDQKPLLVAMQHAPSSLVKIVGLTCMSSTLYILYFGYMSTYLQKNANISFQQALSIQGGLLLLMLMIIPLAGLLGDYVGRRKILFWNTVIILLITLPCFYLFSSANLSIIYIVLCLNTILSAIDQGNNLTAFVENTPIDVRYSGIGFAYNLGNALFGGTAPLIFTLLTTGYGAFAPAYYLIACGTITLFTITTLLNRQQADNIGFLTSKDKKNAEP